MRLLDVLKEYPEGKAFLKRREPILKKIQGLRDEVAGHHREYHQAVEQWHAESQKAVEEGRVPGPPPTPLDPSVEQQVMQHIRMEEQRLHGEQTDVVCSLATEIKVWLFDRETERRERLRPHVAALEEEAREAAADLHLLAEVFAEEQKRMTAIPRPSPLERLVTTVTPERLLAAVQFDASLMDLEPIRRDVRSEPLGMTFTQVEDGEVRVGVGVGGLGGTFGPYPEWPLAERFPDMT